MGESGCGKSTTGHAIVGLLKPTSGDILFEGESIVGEKGPALKERAKKLQIIFQDPYSSLDSASPWAAASASRWTCTRSAPRPSATSARKS